MTLSTSWAFIFILCENKAEKYRMKSLVLFPDLASLIVSEIEDTKPGMEPVGPVFCHTQLRPAWETHLHSRAHFSTCRKGDLLICCFLHGDSFECVMPETSSHTLGKNTIPLPHRCSYKNMQCAFLEH